MSSWLSQHESVILDPAPAAWRCRAGPLSAEARRFREQVGLPTDRPVVMSGHQAAIWHAGIAAKVLALDAACARLGAAGAWVVVDQDVGVPGRITYPLMRAGAAGSPPRLARATLDMLSPSGPDIITGRQPAARCRAVELERGASAAVVSGINAIAAAIDRLADADSRAFQVTRAALDLLGPARGGGGESGAAAQAEAGPTLISALALAQTEMFARMLDLMRRDPVACATHYNAAVRRHPGARLRSLLTAAPGGAELPLWRMTPAGTREPAYAIDLAIEPGAAEVPTLAPRALMMTALLRLGGCDLFIHGLGGGVYDPVMEEWLDTWLGVRDLAPAVVASATRLMSLADEPPPTPEVVARAQWAAHHARHNPDQIVAPGGPGVAGAMSKKHELARAIKRADASDRPRLFRAMHDWLAEQRRAHAGEVAELDARAADLAGHAAQSGIVFDRAWAFPLLPEGSMRSLREEIERAFGAGFN